MSVTQTTSAPVRRIMRIQEVMASTGFRKSHIYAMAKEGLFPRPRKIGLRASGWDSLEISRWIAERLA